MNFLHWARVHWDRVAAVLSAMAGVVALLIGWNGASQTAYPAEQLPYLLSGGLLGLLLFGAGATLWLSADLRDEWGELRGIREELRTANQSRPASAAADTVPVDAPEDDSDTVTVDGLDDDGDAAKVTALVAGQARRA
jgi:hypothetical protein